MINCKHLQSEMEFPNTKTIHIMFTTDRMTMLFTAKNMSTGC